VYTHVGVTFTRRNADVTPVTCSVRGCSGRRRRVQQISISILTRRTHKSYLAETCTQHSRRSTPTLAARACAEVGHRSRALVSYKHLSSSMMRASFQTRPGTRNVDVCAVDSVNSRRRGMYAVLAHPGNRQCAPTAPRTHGQCHV